jgi:hypothetical protein
MLARLASIGCSSLDGDRKIPCPAELVAHLANQAQALDYRPGGATPWQPMPLTSGGTANERVPNHDHGAAPARRALRPRDIAIGRAYCPGSRLSEAGTVAARAGTTAITQLATGGSDVTSLWDCCSSCSSSRSRWRSSSGLCRVGGEAADDEGPEGVACLQIILEVLCHGGDCRP